MTEREENLKKIIVALLDNERSNHKVIRHLIRDYRRVHNFCFDYCPFKNECNYNGDYGLRDPKKKCHEEIFSWYMGNTND